MKKIMLLVFVAGLLMAGCGTVDAPLCRGVEFDLGDTVVLGTTAEYGAGLMTVGGGKSVGDTIYCVA